MVPWNVRFQHDPQLGELKAATEKDPPMKGKVGREPKVVNPGAGPFKCNDQHHDRHNINAQTFAEQSVCSIGASDDVEGILSVVVRLVEGDRDRGGRRGGLPNHCNDEESDGESESGDELHEWRSVLWRWCSMASCTLLFILKSFCF